KSSRFISYIRQVQNEEEASKYLKSIKDKYFNATHHCYAYIVLDDSGEILRFNDDGEPSGTAGKPILSILKGKELSNVICIVVRYFGGTKLGVGGLIRAYSEAARSALNLSRSVKKYFTREIVINFSYESTGSVEHLIEEFNVEVQKREFGESCIFSCNIRERELSFFSERFTDITRGSGIITEI
ncbi:YigZ family protein, partial [candidate division KSB1 bacterium]